MRIEQHLETLGRAAVADVFGEDGPALVRPTSDSKHGDYQLNGALPLAKKQGMNPRSPAEQIAARLRAHDAIASAEVAGPGFVNLRLEPGWLGAQLSAFLADRERDGVPAVEHPQHVVVDFSSPNIAKQMHVGHLRSTIIGDALVRMLRFVGHRVTSDNHIGDWGTQFGLLILGMRKWGSQDALATDIIGELERVYRLASEEAQNDDNFAAQARAELAKLQNGDEENRKLWEGFVRASREKLEEVYSRLNVRFDHWRGESAYHDALPQVVETLLDRGLAREDQGALCVFFGELERAPAELRKRKEPFLIRKGDGAYLYSTTDIATALYRHDHFAADRAIYVVDARQALHFKQLFAVMQLLEVDIQLDHVGFGMVLGDDGRPLRTRDAAGNTITLAALLDEAEERALARIRDESLDVPAEMADEVARVVGLGAVKYADLRQNRASDYRFNWDKMISFKGNAGPYLQYAYARTRSVLRKGEVEPTELAGRVTLSVPEEIALAKTLLRFGEVLHQAAEGALPHLVCEHLYELAKGFSVFWEHCPVLGSDPPTRDSRLALVDLTARQLRRGLSLLGIDVLERM